MQHQETPLPHALRPQTWKQFVGFSNLVREFPFLAFEKIPSLILWGPPGCGKTTLANILANFKQREIYKLHASFDGLGELKKTIEKIQQLRSELTNSLFQHESRTPILFIDEIHRFNKTQQDALLQILEEGGVILIGATTENPSFVLRQALISRVSLVKMEKFTPSQICEILNHALQLLHQQLPDDIMTLVSNLCDGDARMALSALEFSLQQLGSQQNNSNFKDEIHNFLNCKNKKYDQNETRHYDIISAFIKSMRGSDPNAAILWLAVMLEGGEDPLFIARRLMIFAAEDVGNADPRALQLATSCFTAISHIGMPEARILLSQTTTYLSSTLKSNASYLAIDEALEFVRSQQTIEPPEKLRSSAYLYPHDFPDAYVKQEYTLSSIPNFYRPKNIGQEKFFKDRLETLSNLNLQNKVK